MTRNGGDDADSLGGSSPDPSAADGRDARDLPLTLVGFWDGAGTLYLNPQRTQRVVFRMEDVLTSGKVAEDQAPFLGQQATWFRIAPDAPILYVTERVAAPGAGFGVEVRVQGEARTFLGSDTGRACYCRGYRTSGYFCNVPTDPGSPGWDDLFPGG